MITIGDVKCKGDLMAINTYEKSQLLLNAIANSIYDRDPPNERPMYFSVTEIHLVDNFLQDMIKEVEKPADVHA